VEETVTKFLRLIFFVDFVVKFINGIDACISLLNGVVDFAADVSQDILPIFST